MSTVRRIAKNAAFLYASHIITALLAFFFFVTIARILGDVTLGKYSFALSFTAISAVFLDLGFDTLIIREVAQDKTRASKYIGNISVIKVILSIIVFGLIALIIHLMDYPSDTTTAVLIFGGSIVLTALANTFRVTFRAFEQMKYEALALVIGRIVRVSFGLAALFLGYGLIGIAFAALIGSIFDLLFSFLICARKFAKPKFEVDFAFWKKGIKAALPMGFSYAAAMIYVRIDTVMLSAMHGDAVVGWYNAAYNITLSLQPIFRVVGIVIFPVMARLSISSIDSLRITYEKLFRYLFILGLPLTVGTMLLSDRIISLFYGAEFNHSVVALQILAWDLLFSAAGVGMGRVLISMHKQNQLAIRAGAGAVLNIILNLILIPRFSYIGAGIATIATKAVLFGLAYHLTSKYLYRLPIHKFVIKPIIASAVMAAFLYFSSGLNLAVIIVTAIVIYFAFFLLIKGFGKEDRELITKLLSRRGNER